MAWGEEKVLALLEVSDTRGAQYQEEFGCGFRKLVKQRRKSLSVGRNVNSVCVPTLGERIARAHMARGSSVESLENALSRGRRFNCPLLLWRLRRAMRARVS